MPGGGVAHAEIQIGNSRLMLGEEMPEMGYRSPQTLGGTPLGLMLYVENVNEAFPRALKAGAKELRPLKDEFWGDRAGTLLDPFGHRWMIATHTRDVSEAEMQKAMASMSAGG
jgi:PhnB protein